MHQRARHAGRHANLVGAVLAHLFLHFKHSVTRRGDGVNSGLLDVKEIAVVIGAVGVTGCHAEPGAGGCNIVLGCKLHCTHGTFFSNGLAFGDADVF